MHGRAQIRNSFSAVQPDSSERVRYRVEHGERNSISTSNHVLFCLLYKHNMPLLRRKVYLIHECKNRMHNPRKKSIGSVMLGNVKATIFWKYHCLIYSTFLSGPALAFNGKEKAVQSGWRIPVLAISTGCLYRLLLIGVSWYKSTWENKI